MNKAIGIAAAIAAAALAIYLLVGSSDSSQRDAKESASSEKGSSAFSEARSGDSEARVMPPRPLRMSSNEPETTHDGVRTRLSDHVRNDGTVVRDHRSEAFGENLERRVTLPKSLSPVQPVTLAAVRSALRPAMNTCIASHAPDAPEGSSAQAVLTVSIRSEELTVDKLQLSTEGLAEDEELKGCIRDVMLGHTQMVSGAKDVDAHTMTFPYDL